MNLEPLRSKLLAAARAHPPSDRVPYAFEKRILARLTGRSLPDHWAFWARALWRAAAPCVALPLLLGVWSFVGAQAFPGAEIQDLDQHFEQTMLATIGEPEELW